MLLTTITAMAGKPIRTLPRPSASRSAGPESLAHAVRRQKNLRAEARVPRRGRSRLKVRTADVPTRKGRGNATDSSSRKQRTSSAHADTSQRESREPRVRQRRGLKASSAGQRNQRHASRKTAATDQPSVRGRSHETVARARSAAKPIQPEDSEDATASTRQAFNSISPLKSLDQDTATPLASNLRMDSLYDSRGRLIVPAPLYGSHEILVHQNEMADRDGLDRIRDSSGLEDLLRQKKLVALPAGEELQVDDRLPDDRRYSRPWTAAFLSVLSRDFYANFHEPIYITSAVRTVQVQRRLVRTNGNAAPASGDNASPHLTGQAVDIAKKGMSMVQIAWLRTYLQPLIGNGKIDVEEEFRQACFHISVYRSYLPTAPRLSIAAARETSDARP